MNSRRERENTLFTECLREAQHTVNRTVRGTQAMRRKLAMKKAKDLFQYILRESKKGSRV